MEHPTVSVGLPGSNCVTLTPDEARKLAEELTSAADEAEAK